MIFEKNCPACVHLWIKFSFEMQFYEYLGEKALKFLPAQPFFCVPISKDQFFPVRL